MPKRFIDTELWKKPWYMKLSPAEKCAWVYLTTNVDAVGVWTPNTELANFTIGADIQWNDLLTKLNSNVEVLENGKWWLPDFCQFQYGKLIQAFERWADGEEIRGPNKNYIELLMKHGLLDRVVKGTSHNEVGARKRKGIEKEQEKETHGEYVRLTKEEYQKLLDKYGMTNTKKAIDKLNNSIGAKGYKYKSHYRALLNWVFDAIGAEPRGSPYSKCPKCGAAAIKTNAGLMCTKCEHGR